MGCLFEEWYWILRTYFFFFNMCLCIFGYKCSLRAWGVRVVCGEKGERGDEKRESNKKALLDSPFSPSLSFPFWKQTQGVKNRSLDLLVPFWENLDI